MGSISLMLCSRPGESSCSKNLNLDIAASQHLTQCYILCINTAVLTATTLRVGEVLLVDAPWLFRAPWEVIKPLLRKYAALVRFASLEEARALFQPGKAPPDFQ